MQCPVCKRQLQQITAGDVTVEVCKGGCGGLWFDNQELKKFDEPNEKAGIDLLDVEKDESITVDHTQRRNCPKCADLVMMRHFFSVKRQVEVDECPGCGGIWLDAGELGKIRSLYRSEEERRQATEAYFKDVFGQEMTVDEVRSKSATVNRVANMFRFLSPVHHLYGPRDL
jgi:Zn-finger nucleic acid-binding protein